MSFYLYVLLFSFAIPFAYSFDSKLGFYALWKYVIPSLIIVMIPFLLWDYFFVEYGYWGFTSKYITGWMLLNIPVEEMLFFVVIPYCCIFTYYALKHYYPNVFISDRVTQTIGYSICTLSVILSILFFHKAYTVVNFVLLGVVTYIALIYFKHVLAVYLWVFLIIMIPFFIVNGLLTGFAIEDEVVWYNESAIIGLRLFTIPFEDIFYAFSLILSNLILIDFLQTRMFLSK